MAYIVYNDGITTDGVSTFTRDVATRDQQGINRGIDERRYNPTIGSAPLITWTALTGDNPGGAGTPDPLGTGWDHDGITPVAVIKDSASEVIRVFSGETPSEQSVTDMFDIMEGTVANILYQPKAAVVFHGLIMLLCERKEDPGGGFGHRPIGMSIVTSDDLGLNWTVQDDAPRNSIAAGLDEDLDRGRRWAMMNAYPSGGLAGVLGATIPWVDYLSRTVNDNTLLNSDFSDGDDWTFGGGWAFNTDKATHSIGSSSSLSQTPITSAFISGIQSGGNYKAVFTVLDYVAGDVVPVIGGTTGVAVTEDGDYQQVITAGTGSLFELVASSDFDGGVDDVEHSKAEPQGGMCGAFQITRTGVGGDWTVGTNRVLHEEWQTGVFPIHWHCMATTSGGFLIHMGDNSSRNRIEFIPLDLNNFDSGTIGTIETVYGGLNLANELTGHIAPQGIGAAPALNPGEHFACGDFNADAIALYGSISTASDLIIISPAIDRLSRVKKGSLFRGHESFQVTYQTDTGWTVGGVDSIGFPNAWVSVDGINWAEVRMVAEDSTQFLFFYGNKLMMVNDDTQEFMVADIPTIENIKPLQINKGGANILSDNFVQKLAPTAGNVATSVTLDEGLFKTGGTSIPQQPYIPHPFVDDTSMLLIETPSLPTSDNLGQRWLMTETGTDWSQEWVMHGWLCNLSDDKGRWSRGLPVSPQTGGNEFLFSHSYRDNITRGFSPCAWWGTVADTGITRDFMVWDEGTSNVAANYTGMFILEGMNSGTIPTYSLAQGSSGSHELEEYSGAACEQTWSMHLTAMWPTNAPLNSNGSYVIGTAYQSDDEYVEMRWEPQSTLLGDIVATWWDVSDLVDILRVPVDLFPSQMFDIILTRGTGDFTLTARNAGIDIYSDTGIVSVNTPDIKPTALRWSNPDQTEVGQICPIMVNFNETGAWDTTEILAELALTLSERIPAGISTHLMNGNISIVSNYSQFDSYTSEVLENSDLGVFSYNLFYPTGDGLGEVANIYHDSISIDSDVVEVINIRSVTFNPINLVSFNRGMSRIKSFTIHNESGVGDLSVDFSDANSSTVFKDMFGDPSGLITLPPNSYYHLNDGVGAGYTVDINNNNLVISGGDFSGIMSVAIMGDS